MPGRGPGPGRTPVRYSVNRFFVPPREIFARAIRRNEVRFPGRPGSLRELHKHWARACSVPDILPIRLPISSPMDHSQGQARL